VFFSVTERKFQPFCGIASHSKQEFSLFVSSEFFSLLLSNGGRNHSEITASLFCFHFTKSLLYGNLHHSCFHERYRKKERQIKRTHAHKKIEEEKIKVKEAKYMREEKQVNTSTGTKVQ